MTDLPLHLGVIGLGTMGAEMLDIAVAHPDVTVVLAAEMIAVLVLGTSEPRNLGTSEPRNLGTSEPCWDSSAR